MEELINKFKIYYNTDLKFKYLIILIYNYSIYN